MLHSEILNDYLLSSEKHLFSLKDGSRWEGSIISCMHNMVTFLSDKAKKFSHYFNADDIDLQSLYYYDEQAFVWKKFEVLDM
jgi:hypothetical protein